MSTSEQQPAATRVFISYSQHDPAHSRRVLELAQALADDGIDVELDQYHQHESVDWPRWCEERLRRDNSDFVLMICNEVYRSRIEKRVPVDVGRGVFWEGSIIDDYLYEEKANERFIPILFSGETEDALPRIVRGWTWFKLSSFGIASGDVGYTKLYRLLTTQPAVVKPRSGYKRVLPPESLISKTAKSDALHTKPTNLPYPSLGPLFKGREEFIDAIRRSFSVNPERAQVITARHAIHGLGGIGKTRAAVEYAWRFAEDYTALLFVSAETPLNFRAGVAALCSILGIARDDTDESVSFKAVIDWLCDPRNAGWLLILDNLDTLESAEEAEKSFRMLEGGHVLITGRLSEWPGYVESRRIDLLDRSAATEFLLARTADKRQARDDDRAQAGELAVELDGLALALEQAAAFIRRHIMSFSDYLQRWRDADQRVRQWHDARTMQYDRPLAATWQATIDTLPKSAQALLHLLSWLGSDPIPRFIFDFNSAPEELRPLFNDKGNAKQILRILCDDSQADVEHAFTILRDFSLLEPAKDAAFVNEGQIHRVVALITRERQSADEQTASLFAALNVVDLASVGDPQDVRVWPVWEALRPHIQMVLNFAEERGVIDVAPHLTNQLALFFKTKAQHAEAEPLYRRFLTRVEAIHGSEDPTVAIALNNLATLFIDTNRLVEAEPLMRRALEIDETHYGRDHPEVAIDLNNLAQLLNDTNRAIEAEPLMQRALEIDEKALGPEHPKVAIRLNNLALLLLNSGRSARAEPLIRRALDIDVKVFGSEHPTVATDLNTLAQILGITEPTAAEPLLRRALEINMKSFGPTHPNVATISGNLAMLLDRLGRTAEAEPLMRRVLEIDEKSFGPDHPTVAVDGNNLALLLSRLNRPLEAESLISRYVLIFLKFTRTTGHIHPHLGKAIRNYVVFSNISAEAIGDRLTQLGDEAGFDRQEFRDLLNRALSDTDS